jgi:hypothetical protein
MSTVDRDREEGGRLITHDLNGTKDTKESRDFANSKDSANSGRILPNAGAAHADQNGTTFLEKCKKYKWFIVGAVVVFLVALIIGLTVGNKDEPPVPPGPGPDPPTPPAPTPSDYNPYEVSDINLDVETEFVKGNLIVNQEKLDQLNSKETLRADPGRLEVDVKNIPIGDNNQMIKNISFEFG